jgi:RNA polymerase sigma-70 factor (ECF subfamily)
MQQSQPSDGELVAQSLAGNRESFGYLYDRYARLVRAVASGVSLDWPTVQDLAQESFLRAYRNLGQLREPDRFGAWVVGIARQVARERKRTLRRDRHEFVGERPLEIESPTDDGEAVERAEQTQLLLRMLGKLDERERLAIHVFFLQERDANRSAELLNVSRSGLYALVNRGLKRLAELFDRCETEGKSK